MTLVVADTTPLRYLIEIECEGLLPRLFTNVWIPGAVATELRHEHTPDIVRAWAVQLPKWVVLRNIERLPSGHERAGLDRGEWEAIELAKEIHSSLLLIDERAGARIARQQGFSVTGTVGVLVEAARRDLVSIELALDRLRRTNFRGTPELFAKAQEAVRKFRAQ